jgi:large subunit ribosomal protein L21
MGLIGPIGPIRPIFFLPLRSTTKRCPDLALGTAAKFLRLIQAERGAMVHKNLRRGKPGPSVQRPQLAGFAAGFPKKLVGRAKKPCVFGWAVVISPPAHGGWTNQFLHTAMAYAVIKTGGKQYRVQQGTRFDVEKLDVEVDSEIQFDVLLVGEGESVKIGAPIVEGASVTVKVLNQYRGPKGIAFKFKRRKGFHKTKGFRRSLTTLEVTSIAG